MPNEPAELELAVIELADGAAALAVVLRRYAHGGPDLVDISDAGGWRAYRAGRGVQAAVPEEAS